MNMRVIIIINKKDNNIKNHYNHESYERSLKFIKDDDKVIGSKGSIKEADLPTIISSWKFHYNSWKSITSFKSKYIFTESKYKVLQEKECPYAAQLIEGGGVFKLMCKLTKDEYVIFKK